jgi:hypothetical protein
MKAESKLPRLVLVSPWFLLVFLVVPVCVILAFTLQIRVPSAAAKLLLLNNALFGLLVACRFVRYLSGLRRAVRYGSDSGRPQPEHSCPLPVAETRSLLAQAGFVFDASGNYCEKRDPGYLGTTLLYGGLLMLLAVGTVDTLRQFSGTLLDGIGPSTKLSKLENYRALSKGPLAPNPDALPQMTITRQILPNQQYPKGATEVYLSFPDGKKQLLLLKPGEPAPLGDHDIYMSKLIFEPHVVIRTDKGQTVISQLIKLHPLVRKQDGFGFYGSFTNANLSGDVYYMPEKSVLKVVMRRDGKRVMDAAMVFQGDRLVGQADLILSCEKMGQWSEIRVVHRRHMPLLALGGVIALLGLLLRLSVSSQRVWLAAGAEGCRLSVTGKDAKRLLGLSRA